MKAKYCNFKTLFMVVGVALLVFSAHVGWIEPSQAAVLGLVGNMTDAQVRVIDPILSNLARGYKNGTMVGSSLFPFVPVGQRGGQVLQFGKESFKLYQTGRAPGANTKRVNFGYLGQRYSLEQHALEGIVPFEHQQEAQAVPGIDLAQGTVVSVQDMIAIRLEKAQADLARNVANYSSTNKLVLSGSDKWDQYATSKPSEHIRQAIESVRTQTGRRPTNVVIAAAVFAVLQEHPMVLDRTKYTSKDSITAEILAGLWNVDSVKVGDGIYSDDAGNTYDIWGKDVILAFTPLGSIANRGLPSYGYTYRLTGYPMVEQPYYERNSKSWIYPVTDEVQPVIAGADAGFILPAVIG